MNLTIEIDLKPNEEQMLIDEINYFCDIWFHKKPVLRQTDVSGMLAILALQKIANPIKYLQDEAEKEGKKLDGYMAIQLTKDANFYQEIARKALEEIANYR